MKAPNHLRSVILCVDDRENKIEVELFKRVLETAGYTALTAGDAHQALEIFHKNDVDLVLSEHVGPATSDGPSLTANMKRIKPKVPIAIYSADWAESPDDMRFAEMFITKLVSVDELLCMIEKLLTKRPTRIAA